VKNERATRTAERDEPAAGDASAARPDRFVERIWISVAALIVLPITLHNLRDGNLWPSAYALVAAFAVVVFAWAARSPRWRVIGGNVALCLASASIITTFAWKGGLANPSSAWLVLPAIVGTALFGQRQGLVWVVGTSVVIAAFGAAEFVGWDLGDIPETMREPLHMALSRIGVLLVAASMTYWAVRSLRVSVDRLARSLASEKRTRGLAQIQQQIITAANQAHDSHEAISACLGQICALGNWEMGLTYWRDAPSGDRLRTSGISLVAANARVAVARAQASSGEEAPEESVARRVLRERPSHWLLTGDESTPEAAWYRARGVATAVALAVPLTEGALLVVELLSAERREPAPWRTRFIEELAIQIGHVLGRIRAEERFRQLALFDPLTGLANRSTFADRLTRILGVAERNGSKAALLFLDIDEFKRINDTLGHSAGDELLCAVARRLDAVLRWYDVAGRPGSDSVSRLGGDEFTILVTIAEPHDAAAISSRILSELTAPLQLDGQEITVTGSIGIAVFPADGESATDLMRNADAAMYAAKRRGRNNFQFYTAELNERAADRLATETRLRHALERGELHFHFQPVRSAQDGRLLALEALARWHDGERWVPPDEFIPVAMGSGLIGRLDKRILQLACQQAMDWRRRGLRVPRIAVNACASSLLAGQLVDVVREVATATGFEPSGLQIEISERSTLSPSVEVVAHLEELRALGVELAIDDFGTGHASINQLRSMPFDSLKIDRSYVTGIESDASTRALTEAIIVLARRLGLRTVAEGVETEGEARILRELGCDSLQGYALGRPVPASEIEPLLEQEKVG
jgi:diguanylate cyclase (GGDEF)-like protein